MALTQCFPIITVHAAGAANTVLPAQGQRVIANPTRNCAGKRRS